ncbi:hypothetical protein [Salibacterium aidingense]|uniref:hypothetical protein n=1 Tax=Salibacterium aidingense TaxID=384933 RepID=UPI003BEEAAE5
MHQLLLLTLHSYPHYNFDVWRSKKIQDHVESFNDHVFQPLVEHIVIYLGEMKIDMGLDKKSGTHFTFNREFKGEFNHEEDYGQILDHMRYPQCQYKKG